MSPTSKCKNVSNNVANPEANRETDNFACLLARLLPWCHSPRRESNLQNFPVCFI